MLGLPMAAALGHAGIHVIAAGGRWQARAQGQGHEHGQGGFDPSGRPGDHYRVLGVSPSASPQDIKTAFRQRALECHPDVSKEVGAGDKFKHIRLAYEILSDEAKRSEYDDQLVGGGRRHRARKGRVRRSDRGQYRRVVYQAPGWSYDANAGGQGREEEAGEEFYYQEAKSGDRSSGSRKQDFDTGQVLLAGVWAVAVAWHAFGPQVASTFVVAGMALSKQVAVGYRIASGVSLLIGGEAGLLVAVSAAFATLLFGKPQGTAFAVIAVAFWLGGSFMQTMPLPPGAVLVTAYKCIELQFQLEEATS